MRSHARKMGPAADNATVPDGNINTCSIGLELVAPSLALLPPMTISHWPLRESNSLIVASYDPVKTMWGLDVDT
jgi:hypothetical protein